MPRTPTQRQLFDELLNRYGRVIADAFLAAIDDLRSAANLQRLIAAVEARDINAAIAALNLDAAAYNDLLETIRAAYVEGGGAAVSTMPSKDARGVALVIRFDGRNEAAEAWLRAHGADLVTRLDADQRAGVRAALTAGMERGANPRTVALEIVGRRSRVTGKREGGIIGLTAQQEEYARSAQAELASDDPAALKNYLARTRRDKRFDRSVTAAIREERSVPADIAGKAVVQYRNRLLKLRGDTIGRVEAMTALQAAKYRAYVQAVEEGKVDASAVTRAWHSADDLRVRHTHVGLNGESVGLYEAFRSPSGARLMFPGDTSLGASASEIIGCRCDVEMRIDFLANL